MELKRVTLTKKAELELRKKPDLFRQGYLDGFVVGREAQRRADNLQIENMKPES